MGYDLLHAVIITRMYMYRVYEHVHVVRAQGAVSPWGRLDM